MKKQNVKITEGDRVPKQKTEKGNRTKKPRKSQGEVKNDLSTAPMHKSKSPAGKANDGRTKSKSRHVKTSTVEDESVRIPGGKI